MAERSEGARTATVAYSVIIPAYNEAALLPRTLTALAEAMAGVDAPGEVIVVDNNSTDDTAAVARARGATVVFEPHNQISRARNRGAAAARGDVLVFVDADSTLPRETLRQAMQNLRDDACAGGGATVALDGPAPAFVERMLAGFNRVAVTRQFFAGCFIYCRRAAFAGVGGFDERLYASCDAVFSRALKRWARLHGRVLRVIADPPVVTSARKLAHPYAYVASMVVQTLIPFAARVRGLCWYWYRREPVT